MGSQRAIDGLPGPRVPWLWPPQPPPHPLGVGCSTENPSDRGLAGMHSPWPLLLASTRGDGHPLPTAMTRVAACHLQQPVHLHQLPCVNWGWLGAWCQPLNSMVGTTLGHGLLAGGRAAGGDPSPATAGLWSPWQPRWRGSGRESGLHGVGGVLDRRAPQCLGRKVSIVSSKVRPNRALEVPPKVVSV